MTEGERIKSKRFANYTKEDLEDPERIVSKSAEYIKWFEDKHE